MNSNENNNTQNGYRDQSPYVKVFKSGVFIAFKTVNNDWCVNNTKMNIRKGCVIVKKQPFINCRAMFMHLSDFNDLLPGSNEIPVTIKWPLAENNNSNGSN